MKVSVFLTVFSQGTKLTEAPQFPAKCTGSFHVVKRTVEINCVFLKVAAACTYVAVDIKRWIKQGKLKVALSA